MKYFSRVIPSWEKTNVANGIGGVFLAISQSISFLDLSMTTNAEMIWAKVTPIHGEPGSFYRQPHNNADSVETSKQL